MAEEVKDAPKAEEIKKEATDPTVEKVKTISEIIDKPKAEPTMVPEAAFLKEKKERKALEKQLKELEARASSGESIDDISDDIDSLADEFEVNKSFLKRLTQTLEKRAEKHADEKVSTKLKPFEDKERRENIDRIFNAEFTKVIDEMPEYKDVVNKNAIKILSLDPANKDKTFAQLIEETYSNSLRGRKTLETTTPRGGKSPEEIDFSRAKKDTEYFKEIMADPKLKQKYNSEMLNRLRL